MSSNRPSVARALAEADPTSGTQHFDKASQDYHSTLDIEDHGSSRMRPLYWLFGLYAAQQRSGAVLHNGPAVKPLPPSEDPWYKAPPDFEKKQPGDVLRVRQAPGNLTTVVSEASEALHILYRTVNAVNNPSWAVTTLFLPKKFYQSPSGKGALLSYQFAYNSANVDSGPSIGLYWRLAQDNPTLGLKSDTSFISRLLLQGWVINTPDYSGYDAAFGASRQAGHATIDSIRAVKSLCSLTGAAEMTTALWGYSGGTIATGAAVELLTSYAPELKLAGAAMGGMVTDLTAGFDRLNKSSIAATLVAVLLGVTAQFPKERTYLESRLVPETKALFLSVIDIDVFDALQIFAGQDIYAYFINGRADVQAPILQDLFRTQTRIGFGDTPPLPLFVYKAIADEVTPIEPTDALVERWCSQGGEVTYERNTVGSHIGEIENGKPRVLRWLWSLFDESYDTSDRCIVRNVRAEAPWEETSAS